LRNARKISAFKLLIRGFPVRDRARLPPQGPPRDHQQPGAFVDTALRRAKETVGDEPENEAGGRRGVPFEGPAKLNLGAVHEEIALSPWHVFDALDGCAGAAGELDERSLCPPRGGGAGR